MRRTELPLTPLSEPGTASLLRWVAIVSLIIGITMLAINQSQGIGMRPGAPILAALGLILLLLLRLGHLRLATWTLCLGGWFSSLMASYGTLGLLSMNWLTMPLIIMIGGWLLGRVSALILSLLSLAAVAGMYLLHLSGHEFPRSYALATVATGLLATLIVSGLVAGSLAGVFQRQLARLNESRTHLTTLFDSLDDLVWSVDCKTFSLLSFNQAFAARMHRKRGITLRVGMEPEDIDPGPEKSGYWRERYRNAMLRGVYREEFETTDREQLYRITLNVMARNGEPFAISVIAQDITEERARQIRLERAVLDRTHELQAAKETAETASQAKGYFLANMSHEIRTPLTAIIGFAQSLQGDDLSGPERTDAVHTILRNSQHLQDLISDILDFSKIEAGALTLEMTRLSLVEFLADIFALGQALASNRQLDFSCHVMPPIPAMIETDMTRLRQILINLLGNAVKFTGSPGWVRLLVSCDRMSGQLMFTVQDNGIGMSQETLSRLFQSFMQADVSTTRRFGGTGLGLSISRELALRLGGDIQVFSVEHLGSLFVATVATGTPGTEEWLESPAEWRTDPVASSEPVAVASIHLAGQVLLAEDTLDNQRLISLLLRRTGITLTLAENGQQAVERAQETEFDLVLMDMQMPVMGGLEATRMLRLTGFEAPIIALTANATEADKMLAREAGCTDFLSKPLDQAVFFEMLARYLTGQPAASNPSDGSHLFDVLKDDPEYQALRNHFIQELPERLASIQAALAEADWQALKSRAHQLKGVAGSFGYPDTSRVAGEIEACLAAGDHRPLPRLVRQLSRIPGAST
jgi:signal transduction histidine kinase/CheY-like chemotaxis protein/HPt (histidine-containing phosphotransfer) domain-containing protein